MFLLKIIFWQYLENTRESQWCCSPKWIHLNFKNIWLISINNYVDSLYLWNLFRCGESVVSFPHSSQSRSCVFAECRWMVALLLRGGAQRRNLWKMLMPKAGKFSPWIWIDQTLTHHCDSNKGTPLVGLRVYKKGNIFRPMMERQFDDIIIMSLFHILIHIIVPFQIFLSF